MGKKKTGLDAITPTDKNSPDRNIPSFTESRSALEGSDRGESPTPDATSSVPTLPVMPAAMTAKKKSIVEKFCSVSDFVQFIINMPFTYINREELEESSDYKEDPEMAKMKMLTKFIAEFLANLQDCIDFEKTIENIIDGGLANLFVDILQGETDECAKDMLDSGVPPEKIGSVRNFQPSVGLRKDLTGNIEGRYFARYPRQKLLISLINQSVVKDLYHISYEVIKGFLSDLLKTKNLPIFTTMFK